MVSLLENWYAVSTVCAVSFCSKRIAWSKIIIGGGGERPGDYIPNSLNDALNLFYLIPSFTPVARVSLS